MKKELKITKDNYKGYLEFYLAADKERKNKIVKSLIIFGTSYLIAILLLLISTNICIGIAVCSTINVCMETKKIIKKYEISDKIKNSIIEEYPYVDTKIKYNEIYKMLFEKGLIKRENSEEIICENEYLNYIECEEIKKELLKEPLYETTIKDLAIPESELVKVKKLIYPPPYRGR